MSQRSIAGLGLLDSGLLYIAAYERKLVLRWKRGSWVPGLFPSLIHMLWLWHWNLDSIVGIVTRLRAGIPGGGKIFSFLKHPNHSGANIASHSMDISSLFTFPRAFISYTDT